MAGMARERIELEIWGADYQVKCNTFKKKAVR